MLRVFQRIRKRLFSENKFSKYLLYAFGEVTLVVIGILIALQVNNWNEKRLERAEEKEVLLEIRNSLAIDLEDQFDLHLSNCDLLKNRLDVIYMHLSQDLPYHDSLAGYFTVLSFEGAKNWRPQSSAFESLQSKGVDLIKSTKVKDAILNIYHQDYPDIINVFENYKENVKNYGRPFSRTLFSFGDEMFNDEKDDPLLIPVDYKALTQHVELMNVIKVLKMANLRDERRLLDLRSNVESVIKIIDAELAK